MTRPRIVVLDGYTANPGDNPWDEVASLGELVVHDRTPASELLERAQAADALVTNKTPLRSETLKALPELRFVQILATGIDVVDVDAARAQGVIVSNVPEYSTDSVAQHTFALLLAVVNRIPELDAAVHAGRWSFSEDFAFWREPPVELAGKCMGIVGAGRIGRRVAALARSFGMEVVVAESLGGPAAASAEAPLERRPLDEVFATADVVSLHCPLTPATRALVSRERLALMKPTAILLNTARGGLLDEAAVAAALASGRLAAAAVDCAAVEPAQADNPLLAAPRCIVTPHVAWATLAARRRLLRITAANLRGWLAGAPQNLVSVGPISER